MTSVIIDGVEFVPKTTVISEQTLQHLGEAYSLAFGNGVYDPPSANEYIHNTFRNIYDHLKEANKELHFKK